MDISQIVKRIQKYWQDMDKIDKLIILVLFFVFVVRILFLLTSPHRGWDETVYLNLGNDLGNNPFHYSLLGTGWSDFIPSTDTIYGWPNVGFRAPLLPYVLSIFYALNLNFLIPFIVPFFATCSVFLVYILGGKLFNKKVGLYSAVLFSLIPIHVFYSGKVLTDTFVVFFILLTFISFYEGYEKGNIKHKVLFGLFLALALLARYTTLWIIPVFLLYFIFRDKSFKFLKDKHLWQAIGVFFLVLMPWFIYSFVYYGNVFGAFIHGFKAAKYWGGIQSWNFFFINSWINLSIIGLLFLFALLYFVFKKEFLKREIYLLLFWIIFFSLIVMTMPHKEDRFIMPIIPALCLISGLFISRVKKYQNTILVVVCVVSVISLANLFKIKYEDSKIGMNLCFSEGNKFLASDFVEENNLLIITNQLPIVHYYTHREVALYPDPLNLGIFQSNINYKNKEVYFFFSNYDMDLKGQIKKDLDSNFKKVFECNKKQGYSAIYKYE